MRAVLMFPGQGSQYSGMGKALYGQYPGAREMIEQAGDYLGWNVKKFLLEEAAQENLMGHIQPLLFILSMAYARYFESQFDMPIRYAVGNSLGELAALCHAGCFSFETGLMLVARRGALMEAAAAQKPGGMMAVMGDKLEVVVDYIEKCQSLWVSTFNAPTQITISGADDQLNTAQKHLKEIGYKVAPLPIGAACHSPYMGGCTEEWKTLLCAQSFSDMKVQVISALTGKPYPDLESIPELLTAQLTMPVQFQKAIAYLQERSCDVFVEVGPKTVLRNLLRNRYAVASAFAMESMDDRKQLEHLCIAWKETEKKNRLTYDTVLRACMKLLLSTPASYANMGEYTEACKNFDELSEIISRTSNRILTEKHDLARGLQLTALILKAKGCSHEAAQRMIREIILEWNVS